MKSKLYYILLCLLFVFSFVDKVFAEENLDFSVTSTVVGEKTSVPKESEVAIHLVLNSSENINSCTFDVETDSGIEVKSRSGMNNFNIQFDQSDNIVINRSENTEFVSGKGVLELNLLVNDAGNITIKTISCSSLEEGKTGSYKDIVLSFDVEEGKKDTTLSDLSVIGGTLSSSFSSNVKSYSIQLESSNFSLKMTASNSEYQDKIKVKDTDGNVLDYNNILFKDNSGQALMKLIISVNEVDEYTLFVSYKQKELDNSLATLKVDGKAVELSEGKYDYTIEVDKSIISVKIDATLVDSDNFKFSDSNGPTNFYTLYEKNTYPIIVEPKDSSTGAEQVVYTINIIKKGFSINDSNMGNINSNNTGSNPSTGGISMAVMVLILFVSLICSIIIYQRNLENYNK